jgi:hypothetical protein
MLVSTFADLYRQEVGAEEDVHRTLPFFGTALGIVIGALAYAAGRLPKWLDLPDGWRGKVAFAAIARRDYQRIGPETALRSRLTDLQAYYEGQGVDVDQRDKELLKDMRLALLESYTDVTPANRDINQRRYKFRALASSHLVRSLIWALAATSVIFLADKLGYLPKVTP